MVHNLGSAPFSSAYQQAVDAVDLRSLHGLLHAHLVNYYYTFAHYYLD